MQSFPTMMKIIILQSCVQGLYLGNIERSHVQAACEKRHENEGQARESSPFVCPLLTHFLTAHLVHFDDKNGEFACTAGKQLFLPNIPQAAQM